MAMEDAFPDAARSNIDIAAYLFVFSAATVAKCRAIICNTYGACVV